MDLPSAVRAAAPDAPSVAIAGLEQAEAAVDAQGALANEHRVAHLIGQCAHESARFTRLSEGLFYSTADRLIQIFPRHFRDLAHAGQFTRNPEKLANHVYANRMGNGAPASGDGFRFRGRGYLQLTGRSNYRVFGRRIAFDLEADPDRAADPATAWMIAASYLAHRKRQGRTALEWADDNNVEAVTRIVNGGIHGLADRRNRTLRALASLGAIESRPLLKKGAEGPAVELLQRALAAQGMLVGAIDGDFGPKTKKAVKAFQAQAGLGADGVVGENTWRALEPLPS